MRKITKKIKLFVLKLSITIHNAFQLRKVHAGKHNMVFGKIEIVNPWNLTVGNDCSFNHGVYINAFNSVEIGNDVTLSAGAKVISTGIDYYSWVKGKKQHVSGGGYNPW